MKLKSISSKLISYSVIILLAVFVVLTSVCNFGFRLIMNNYIKRSCYSLQEELDSAATEIINESAYMYGRIMSSSNVSFLNSIGDDSLDSAQRQQSFSELCARIGADNEYLNDIAIVAGGSIFTLYGSDPPTVSSLEYLTENSNKMLFVMSTDDSIVMGIYSVGGTMDFSGVFLFYMNESVINSMFNPVNMASGYTFLMRSDGYIISHTDASLIGRMIVYSDVYDPASAPEYKTELLDSVRRIVVTSATDTLNSRYGFDSVVVSVLDYDYYFGDMNTMLIIVTIVCLAALILATILSVLRAKAISRPLVRLSEKINSVSRLEEAAPPVLEEGDELKQLEDAYDKMTNRIFNLVEENKKDIQRQRKLELDSLYMQINPHFLYNTLDAISWMARLKKQPEIDRLVMNLAKFFRLFLHGGDKFVTVADEVEMIKNYLEIDAVRHPGRLDVHFDVSDDAAGEYILKLILQPIVENSLKYAFVSRKRGNIYIRAAIAGEDILLEIEDDGDGFDVPDDVLEIKPSMEGGYGLKNVHERIRLQYGEGYGLTVRSKRGVGTIVQMRLKKIPPSEE